MTEENELTAMAKCTGTMDCSTVFKETPHLCLTQVVHLFVNLRTKQTVYLKL